MNLRAATTADVPALSGLEELLFGADAWSAEMIAADLDAPGRRVLVADDGGRVLGYAVTMLGGDLVDLQRVGVAPAAQGQGVARCLLARALQAGVEDGAEAMLLEVSTENAAALRLYRSSGFTKIDRRRGYYRDGSDALVLRRPVRPGVDA